MDVFALSSDTEQMPVALLEAMACSLPVVATDVGDVLAEQLTALLRDRELRARLGRQNRARVEERFSFEAMLAAYRAVYTAALQA
jgi:glycosyltransferase involved in cell wall biosynthesis